MSRLELEGSFNDNLLNFLFYDVEGEYTGLGLRVYTWKNEHIMKITFKLKVVIIDFDEAV